MEDQARWIASRPKAEFNYVIELKDGRPIGMLSLVEIDLANRRAESARFLIGDEEAARGVPAAVEAMSLLYELAFDRLGLERIHGVVEAGNPLMVKWQKYLGMREEGRFRRHFLMDGQFKRRHRAFPAGRRIPRGRPAAHAHADAARRAAA